MNNIVGLALVVSLVVGCGAQGASTTAVVPGAPLGRGPSAPTQIRLATESRIPTPSSAATAATAPTTELARLVGQKLVVRMQGTTPSVDLLGRIRRGEIGGVVLFGANITTRAALVAMTAKLRAAALAGHQPRFLIAVDQEGGPVKRIPWAPPTISPPRMGTIAQVSVARSQGAATGTALRGLGINVDFAPVADVPASTASFMYRGLRTFSFSARRTAALADAFATGLESTGVVPTMKHFPGIGYATLNTDASVVTIKASRALLAPGLAPYRTAIGHHIPLIMLSNATYTAYDATSAAGWSSAVGITLLRHALGFTGATITDALDGTAKARGLSLHFVALRAARAGTDLLLVTGSEASSRAVYANLLGDATSGLIPTATLRASYLRILALKRAL
jgi:beta-N-acetylhexosaminidase